MNSVKRSLKLVTLIIIGIAAVIIARNLWENGPWWPCYEELPGKERKTIPCPKSKDTVRNEYIMAAGEVALLGGLLYGFYRVADQI